ncbi:hypothetical protein GCM10010387_43750 [Streptomyces inusitatus]|uniref:Uncharacterized protein n=1 Tax=Streptomyces inusitatus TaxID=68221 RepID=A0A918QGR9_9ACTN|nr:hypothetical protein [Streptomyces inusitatus]GGZ44703.1 hypothetical protein GCM10010387_43750 [Streptomyces inusitatus]
MPSHVQPASHSKWVAWEFACTCGRRGRPRDTPAAAEADRQAHIRREHPGLWPSPRR